MKNFETMRIKPTDEEANKAAAINQSIQIILNANTLTDTEKQDRIKSLIEYANKH